MSFILFAEIVAMYILSFLTSIRVTNCKPIALGTICTHNESVSAPKSIQSKERRQTKGGKKKFYPPFTDGGTKTK